MQQLWLRISAAAVLGNAAACTPPVRAIAPPAERLSGCFRRIYADGPPGAGTGGMLYTLTTDAGSTHLLEVSREQLANAGGPSALDGARVTVVLAPSADSSLARPRRDRVREIRREPSTATAPC